MGGQFTRSRVLGVFIVVASLGCIAWASADRIRYVYEDALYAFFPSAERAYIYGIYHFDAERPGMYDLARAEYFFREASEQNPDLPYAMHQLARIAFLRGDFEEALARINIEIATNENVSPTSFYMRGLIKGFMDDFDGAAKDYEKYLETDANNWAALNDYAWVLLKDGRALTALNAVDWGLIAWPENPWLLNSKATAHFELGQMRLAAEAATRAGDVVEGVTEEDWLQAYPGNDPLIARQGVEALRRAITDNIHTISLVSPTSAK